MTVTGTGKFVVRRSTPPPPLDPTYGAGVTAPAAWGADWRTYRDTGTSTARRDFPVFGDSTVYGSEGMYSFVQQLRKRAVAAGLTDGGKGIFAGGEAGITYDPPEVNGFVSSTFTGNTDTYDNLVGQYYKSSVGGETLTVQFRSTAIRLWWVDRFDAGGFTYSVDGGAAVVVDAVHLGYMRNQFVYISGLTPGVTHTLTITNRGGRGPSGSLDTSTVAVFVAFAPVNEVGVAFQKQATSGARILDFFHGSHPSEGAKTGAINYDSGRYQTPLGLVHSPEGQSPRSTDGYVAGNTVDTSYPGAARIRPILAMMDLGFNDLSDASLSDLNYTEGIRKFAAACRAADCDGIVSTGNMPVNANWPTDGVRLYNLMKQTAATEGLAFVDLWQPFGGALNYTGGTANPHLSKAQYVQQGDYLWDSLLGV